MMTTMSTPAPADEDTLSDDGPPSKVCVTNPRPAKPKYGDVVYIGYKMGHITYMMNGVPKADGTGFQDPPAPLGAGVMPDNRAM